MELKKLTCIECPIGCDMEVELEDGKVLSVTGNSCPRGKLYAENEARVYDIEQIKGGNHGGGDVLMIRTIINAYDENRELDKNGIEGAMCSHYLGFAAEESRIKGGEKIVFKKLQKYLY